MQYYDNYEGTLAGESIEDLRKDLNEMFAVGVIDLKTRRKNVDNFLKKHKDYLNDYQDEVYKPCINSDGVISCYLNVPRLLDEIATYLIHGQDENYKYDHTYFYIATS